MFVSKVKPGIEYLHPIHFVFFDGVKNLPKAWKVSCIDISKNLGQDLHPAIFRHYENSGPWIWMLQEMCSISLPLYVDPFWSNVAWCLRRILKPFLFYGTIGQALGDFRKSFYASSSSVLLGVSPISSRLQFDVSVS